MPGRSARPCSYPGCNTLTLDGTGRCARHPREAWRHDRASRHDRGYGTAWDKLRKTILQRDHYLCQCDQCQGGEVRVTPAQEVDHRVPKAQGGTDDPSNLRAVSTECHRRITMQQMGASPKPRIGRDGWPIQ